MNSPFTFKQFTVQQDRCAMKIGTDGVLLGAWASVFHGPNTILDIGAGTGLVALMLAQRCAAGTIDGVEIDDDAYEQCVDNFEASPWADRLFCYHASFEDFVAQMDETYDLIVSNPPFHQENVGSGSAARDRARQNRALPFVQLFKGVATLLHKLGLFAVIVPHSQEVGLIKLAKTYGLYPQRIMRVKGSPDSAIKRSLLEFGFKKGAVLEDELVIEEKRHRYTKAYQELTRAFYKKM